MIRFFLATILLTLLSQNQNIISANEKYRLEFAFDTTAIKSDALSDYVAIDIYEEFWSDNERFYEFFKDNKLYDSFLRKLSKQLFTYENSDDSIRVANDKISLIEVLEKNKPTDQYYELFNKLLVTVKNSIPSKIEEKNYNAQEIRDRIRYVIKYCNIYIGDSGFRCSDRLLQLSFINLDIFLEELSDDLDLYHEYLYYLPSTSFISFDTLQIVNQKAKLKKAKTLIMNQTVDSNYISLKDEYIKCLNDIKIRVID